MTIRHKCHEPFLSQAILCNGNKISIVILLFAGLGKQKSWFNQEESFYYQYMQLVGGGEEERIFVLFILAASFCLLLMERQRKLLPAMHDCF